MSYKDRLDDIPYGSYCYTIKDIELKNGMPIIKTLLCPHYQFLEDGRVGCSFLGNDNLYEYDLCLDDQVKVCGVNELDEEIDLEEHNNICCICGKEFTSKFQGSGIVCGKECKDKRNSELK